MAAKKNAPARDDDMALTDTDVARALSSAAYTAAPTSDLRRAFYRPREVGGAERAQEILRAWVADYVATYNQWVDDHGWYRSASDPMPRSLRPKKTIDVRGNTGGRAPKFRAGALGQRLRKFAGSPEAKAVAAKLRYPVTGRPIRGYTAGGCFVFAEAFGRWAGPAAELLAWTVFDQYGAYKEIDHVFARIGDHYFDADGVWTETQARDRYGEAFNENGWIAPFTVGCAERSWVGCDAAPMQRLLRAMRDALGAPADWNVPEADDRGGWSTVVADNRRLSGGSLMRELGLEGIDEHSMIAEAVVRNSDLPRVRAGLGEALTSVEPLQRHCPHGKLPRSTR